MKCARSDIVARRINAFGLQEIANRCFGVLRPSGEIRDGVPGNPEISKQCFVRRLVLHDAAERHRHLRFCLAHRDARLDPELADLRDRVRELDAVVLRVDGSTADRKVADVARVLVEDLVAAVRLHLHVVADVVDRDAVSLDVVGHGASVPAWVAG